MRSTSNELTGAERVYRFVAQAIRPLLASGFDSRTAAYGLAAVFLFMLGLAATSAYLKQANARRSTLISGDGSNLAFTGRHFRQNRRSVLKSAKESPKWQHLMRQMGNPG